MIGAYERTEHAHPSAPGGYHVLARQPAQRAEHDRTADRRRSRRSGVPAWLPDRRLRLRRARAHGAGPVRSRGRSIHRRARTPSARARGRRAPQGRMVSKRPARILAMVWTPRRVNPVTSRATCTSRPPPGCLGERAGQCRLDSARVLLQVACPARYGGCGIALRRKPTGDGQGEPEMMRFDLTCNIALRVEPGQRVHACTCCPR